MQLSIYLWQLRVTMQLSGSHLTELVVCRQSTVTRKWSGSFNAVVRQFIRILKAVSIRKLYNKFIRCFHQFVSPILYTNFSQFVQLKKKTNLLLVQNSLFLSLPLEKQIISNRYSLKKYVDSEFEIGETI